jgi:hypothetical protein
MKRRAPSKFSIHSIFDLPSDIRSPHGDIGSCYQTRGGSGEFAEIRV